jgi:hypothetical protein
MNNPGTHNITGRELVEYDRYVSPTGQEVYFLSYEYTKPTEQGIYSTYKETITYPPLKSSVQPKSPEEVRECAICNELFHIEDTVRCDECGIVLCKQDAEFTDEEGERVWLCPDHMSKRESFLIRIWKSLFKV